MTKTFCDICGGEFTPLPNYLRQHAGAHSYRFGAVIKKEPVKGEYTLSTAWQLSRAWADEEGDYRDNAPDVYTNCLIALFQEWLTRLQVAGGVS